MGAAQTETTKPLEFVALTVGPSESSVTNAGASGTGGVTRSSKSVGPTINRGSKWV